MLRTVLGVISESRIERLGNLREVGYKFLTRVGERSGRQGGERDRSILHRSLVADFLKRLQRGEQ